MGWELDSRASGSPIPVSFMYSLFKSLTLAFSILTWTLVNLQYCDVKRLVLLRYCLSRSCECVALTPLWGFQAVPETLWNVLVCLSRPLRFYIVWQSEAYILYPFPRLWVMLPGLGFAWAVATGSREQSPEVIWHPAWKGNLAWAPRQFCFLRLLGESWDRTVIADTINALSGIFSVILAPSPALFSSSY